MRWSVVDDIDVRQISSIQMLALPLTCGVMVSKLLGLSEPFFLSKM